MPVHRSTLANAPVLHNPGKQSAQIVSPLETPDARATITRVTMEVGAISSRHSHPISEQIWLVEDGEAMLLLEGDVTEVMRAGDVIRTPPGVIHGIENTGGTRFVYLTITTPPEDMTPFYQGRLK